MMKILALLLALAHVHCLTDGELYINSLCKMSYEIKDLYNVTIEDLGPVCPKGKIMPASNHNIDYSKIYRLNIKPTHNGREVEIEWEHSNCYQEYYMQLEASFQPDWRLDDTRRKCIRVILTRLSNEWTYETGRRLHFNCLQINSRKMGTLKIENNRHNTELNCPERGSSDSITFDLGCSFDRTDVEIDNCLTINFHRLNFHTDFRKTKIEVSDGTGYCSLAYDGTRISRMSDNPLQGQLNLPVYGEGNFSVYILLVCDASGELANKILRYEQNVMNARSCSSYNSSVISACRETSTQPVVSTVQFPLPKEQLYTVVSVASVLVTVVVIVTVVFIHRKRRYKSKSTSQCQQEGETIQLQSLGENQAHNHSTRDIPTTTTLHTEF